MKTSILLVVGLVLMGCSKFWDDSLTGPVIVLPEPGSQVVSLVLAKSIPDSAYFKSNMWLNADSTGTEYREVQLVDSLAISTLVSESQAYKGRISSDGTVYFTGFTIGGVVPTHWIMHETQGPWFWFDVDPSGSLVQFMDNLADTVVIPVEIYAPQGNTYEFNGSGTDFDNRAVPWDAGLGYYRVNLITLPGTHRYDWWGSSIDSVKLGNVTVYDIGGGHIRFEIVDSTQIMLLDSLSGSYRVSWSDTTLVDSVSLMMADQLGDRSYPLVNQFDEWARQVVMPSDRLIHLRVEADNVAQFTNVEVQNIGLHHLVELDTSQYWFEFRLVNNDVVQDSNNVVTTVNIYP